MCLERCLFVKVVVVVLLLNVQRASEWTNKLTWRIDLSWSNWNFPVNFMILVNLPLMSSNALFCSHIFLLFMSFNSMRKKRQTSSRKVLILVKEEWQLSALVNLFASFCNWFCHGFWSATENSNFAHLLIIQIINLWTISNVLLSIWLSLFTLTKARFKDKKIICLLTHECWFCTYCKSAAISGRPKWFTALRPVKRLLFDIRWKWFSQIY